MNLKQCSLVMSTSLGSNGLVVLWSPHFLEDMMATLLEEDGVSKSYVKISNKWLLSTSCVLLSPLVTDVHVALSGLVIYFWMWLLLHS